MKYITKIVSILSLSLICMQSQAAYWQEVYNNGYSHFSNSTNSDIQNWTIGSGDNYIVGDFFFSNRNYIIGTKVGEKNMHIEYNPLNLPNEWTVHKFYYGHNSFAGLWTAQTDDIYAVGDFTGNTPNQYYAFDNVLVANPNGNYKTIKGDLFSNGNNNSPWRALQSANNGDIDAGDKLIPGDFNGDGKDEVILIKANGSHFTMSFNTQTANWDILSSDTSGSINWWHININDNYVAGDFNGDGKDELIAISTNGWSHTMSYSNNQWGYITGTSNGFIGQWNITSQNTQYLSSDFNSDGIDEILAINPNGWTHTLKMSNGTWPTWPTWQTIRDNNGDGNIALNRAIYSDDIYRVFGNNVLSLNPSGSVLILEY